MRVVLATCCVSSALLYMCTVMTMLWLGRACNICFNNICGTCRDLTNAEIMHSEEQANQTFGRLLSRWSTAASNFISMVVLGFAWPLTVT